MCSFLFRLSVQTNEQWLLHITMSMIRAMLSEVSYICMLETSGALSHVMDISGAITNTDCHINEM